MGAAVWSAIGILGAAVVGVFAFLTTFLGRFDAVNARIDALGAQLGARIDAQSAILMEHVRHHAG